MEDHKKDIIDRFMTNVKGKSYNNKTKTHHGSEGYWLEMLMGIKNNNANEPDIYGYEMKKNSAKISLGDFSASEYLFSPKKEMLSMNHNISKTDFIHYFGSPNKNKSNRYSWSGHCVPKYGDYNDYGQILEFDDHNNLCIIYSYEKDQRVDKSKLPEFLKIEPIIIAIWKKDKLKYNIENKFNKQGFFICKKNAANIYDKICFGKPFDFEHFVENVKVRNIIFDSGMYEGNNRNYSQFRCRKDFWNLLIIQEYS